MKVSTWSLRFLVLAACWLAAGHVWAADPPGAPDFLREVRPILSDKCFRCHGPDANERQGGFRLDELATALEPADSGARPIVPGKPEESELVRRIETADADERMPPADSGKTLSAAEKDILRRWIAAGAPRQELWSFVAPRRPKLPAVRNTQWPRNAVDFFVLARLEAAGLEPEPEADRATLIRRVTLDLTGLPPTLEEIDAFLNDQSPNAYEKVVDRLLSSVHYGERMAVDWLDAARFADTHGYHIDSGRDMSHWREWVINAYHQNKPYDEFIVEQLAGDLLPNATLQQKIASGFNRNHMINFEGGAIPLEYHTAYIVDRVNTTGSVFLGLTVACAQCHDHKYDPISQKEYYQLFAFFHNVPENGLDGSKGNAMPFIPVPTKEQQQELDRLQAEMTRLRTELEGPSAELDAAQARWEAGLQSFSGTVAWQVLKPQSAKSSGGATLTTLDDLSVLATGENPARDVHEFAFQIDKQPITAIELAALTHESLPDGGPGRFANSNFVLTDIGLVASSARDPSQSRPIKLKTAYADYAQKDFDIAKAFDGDPKSGWAVDGHIKKENRRAVLVPEEPFGYEGGTTLQVTLKYESIYGQHAIGRTRISVTQDPRAALELPENINGILGVAAAERTEEQQATLRKYFRENVAPEAKKIRDELAALEAQRGEVQKNVATTMVMQEMEKPRDTFVLVRGEYNKPGQKVEPGVPASLPPFPENAPRNRLGLAQWLVSPDQPLTARVTVNRFWQLVFGTGLVETSEDFGSQGALPSHPELLDWLACEFTDPTPLPLGSGGDHRWDVRAFMRMLVTSAAYRQSSRIPDAKLAMDPDNRLLSRGSRFRLQAEFIRDQALAVSGLLDRRVGGRSVSPYQPPGLWDELASREDGKNWTAQTYTQSHGADLYRRTMYTFWKRTSPPPTLATFDAPDRETCTLRRARTNTPLQALVLLNDPTYVEASRKLAERILRDGGATQVQRITFAFRQLTARPPTPRELAILGRLLKEQRDIYAADPEAAEQLLSVGESPRDESLDAAELAAWTMLSSAILNLDETITRG